MAHERMIATCKAEGSLPIVLSPFPFGQRYKDRNAREYRDLLKALTVREGVPFVDCYELLGGYPRSQVLLADGMHLTEFSHSLLGTAVHLAVAEGVANYLANRRISPCSVA